MDSVSPQDVYARHLVSQRGYPLWTPEPSLTLPDVYRREGLKIGDVGVVVPEDGSFDVLFNICLPPTHALHRRRGVPDNFNPVVLEDEDIMIFPEAESTGRIISTSSVARIGTQSSNENMMRDTQAGLLDYQFTLSAREGALLILPEGAQRYYLRNQRPFLEEAIQHAVDWYNFAEGRLGRIISHDSLYLITGFYKSRSWSLASYQHGSGISDVHAQFKAVQVGGGNVSRSYTWETTHSLDWRVGPSDKYYNGIPNQSIFIQGFKIAVRSSILGAKRVEVKEDFPSVRPHRATFYGSVRRSRSNNARLSSSRSSALATSTSKGTDAELYTDTPGPEGKFDSYDSVHDDDVDITIQHVPQVQKPFHPSDSINEFLLRTCTYVNVAITHDVYWTTLLEHELIRPEELEMQDLENLVLKMSQLVEFSLGAVYLGKGACDGDIAGLNTGINSTQATASTSRSKQIPPPTSPEIPNLSKLSLTERSSVNPPPFAGQPTKPLKSILTEGDGTELRGPASRSDKLSGKMTALFSFPKSQFGLTEPSEFNPHWMLLPYDPQGSKRLLQFNVVFPVDRIVFLYRGLRTQISDIELDTSAADFFMTRMPIIFEHGSFTWEVNVWNNEGIRCREVFQAIYEMFKEPLTLEERHLLFSNQEAADEAFRSLRGRADVERPRGLERVDLLRRGTMFLGLTRPRPRGKWVLNLGPPLHIPGLSTNA